MILTVFFAGCHRRGQPQQNVSLKGKEVPTITFLGVLAGPAFNATVIERKANIIPNSDAGELVKVLFVLVEQDDGTELAITALSATDSQVKVAMQLQSGQKYRFPDALREASQ